MRTSTIHWHFVLEPHSLLSLVKFANNLHGFDAAEFRPLARDLEFSRIEPKTLTADNLPPTVILLIDINQRSCCPGINKSKYCLTY